MQHFIYYRFKQLFFLLALLSPVGNVYAQSGSPAFCNSQNFGDMAVCVASHPKYCSDRRFVDSLACVGSQPGYCVETANADGLACIGSHPAFCSDVLFHEKTACAGAMPPFCQNSQFSSSPACLRAKFLVVPKSFAARIAKLAPQINSQAIWETFAGKK